MFKINYVQLQVSGKILGNFNLVAIVPTPTSGTRLLYQKSSDGTVKTMDGKSAFTNQLASFGSETNVNANSNIMPAFPTDTKSNKGGGVFGGIGSYLFGGIFSSASPLATPSDDQGPPSLLASPLATPLALASPLEAPDGQGPAAPGGIFSSSSPLAMPTNDQGPTSLFASPFASPLASPLATPLEAPDGQGPVGPAAALNRHDDTRSHIMQIVAHALGRGSMVIFGDFSLKALIHDWDHALLGPLPFEEVGTVSGSVRLRFQREHLMECPSAQLQCVGELCSDNFAGVHALGGTIQFVVKHDRPASDMYQLQILTVAEAPPGYQGATVEVGKYNGTAGHVLLKYRSGGMMLVSATHWMELTNVNANEADVAQVLLQRQGEFAAAQFQEELNSCRTAADRKACSASRAAALVQLTSPSPSSIACKKNPSAPV